MTTLFILSLTGGFVLYGLVCSWLYRKYGWNDAPNS
jgi:hypothetical protein